MSLLSLFNATYCFANDHFTLLSVCKNGRRYATTKRPQVLSNTPRLPSTLPTPSKLLAREDESGQPKCFRQESLRGEGRGFGQDEMRWIGTTETKTRRGQEVEVSVDASTCVTAAMTLSSLVSAYTRQPVSDTHSWSLLEGGCLGRLGRGGVLGAILLLADAVKIKAVSKGANLR